MNDDLKKKIKIAVVLFGGALLILLIIFLTMFTGKSKVENSPLSQESDNRVVAPQNGQLIKANDAPVVKTEEKKSEVAPVKRNTEEDARKMAASFAERFGTYSNQSGFSNMTNLQVYMSEKMKAWADEYVTKQKNANTSEVYFGITTKAVTQEVKSFDENAGAATILVKTRRREATNSISSVSNVYNQDITINLIKDGSAWKVDSAFWEKRL